MAKQEKEYILRGWWRGEFQPSFWKKEILLKWKWLKIVAQFQKLDKDFQFGQTSWKIDEKSTWSKWNFSPGGHFLQQQQLMRRKWSLTCVQTSLTVLWLLSRYSYFDPFFYPKQVLKLIGWLVFQKVSKLQLILSFLKNTWTHVFNKVHDKITQQLPVQKWQMYECHQKDSTSFTPPKQNIWFVLTLTVLFSSQSKERVFAHSPQLL